MRVLGMSKTPLEVIIGFVVLAIVAACGQARAADAALNFGAYEVQTQSALAQGYVQPVSGCPTKITERCGEI